MTHFFQTKIEAYLHRLLKVYGYSPATIKTYRSNLSEAFNYVSIEPIEGGYRLDLILYRMKLVSKHKKTIYKKVSIVRSFCTFLEDEGYTIVLKNDENIKLPKTLPKPINTAHIYEALAGCDISEKVMMLLFYSLGLRVSELSQLKIKDIQNGWVRINGKGAKIREIPLLNEVEIVLDEYLQQYTPIVYVFEKNKIQLSENQIRYRLTKVFKKIGIKATPHQLRHSFATDLLREGARITDVSELLGHASLETTQIYTKLTSSVKKKHYLRSHPMCREQDESV